MGEILFYTKALKFWAFIIHKPLPLISKTWIPVVFVMVCNVFLIG